MFYYTHQKNKMKIITEVNDYLKKKKHPLTKEIQKVREIILSTDDRIEETIKWSSPTFMYEGNIASFFMNAKKFVSLMFHKGAIINDKFWLLEGDGEKSRVARFQNLDDNPPIVEVLAESGALGNTNGSALTSTFMYPNGVAVTKTGDSIYINSSTNSNSGILNPQVIRLLTGVLSTEQSVETVAPLLNLKTYPNPITKEFTIESELLTNYKNLSFKLFDINGKVVKEIKKIDYDNQHFKAIIDLSSLASGSYLYSLFNKDKLLANGKVIKD